MKKLLSLILSIIMVASVFFAVPFTVSADEVTIESVHVEPLTFVEGTCGHYSYDWDWEAQDFTLEYFAYDYEDYMEYTITLTNGEVITDTGNGCYIESLDDYIWFNGETYQSYDNQWVAGNTYNATVELMGIRTTFPVTIEKSPVKSISVKPLTLAYGADGDFYSYYDDESDSENMYFYFWYEDKLEYTIVFTDGTTISGKGSYIEYNGQEYEINTNDNQSYEKQWTVGNTYYATVGCMGAKTTVPITIEQSPVKSITIQPVTVYDNIDGYTAEIYGDDDYTTTDSYFCYEYEDMIKYTVTFTDGTIINGSGSYVEYNGEEYPIYFTDNQSYYNQWEANKTYTAQASFMGKTANLTIYTKPNPIKDIVVIETPDKTVFDQFECISPKGAVLRINYTDGTHEDISLEEYVPFSNNYTYVSHLNREFPISIAMEIYDETYTIYFLNHHIDFEGRYMDKEVISFTVKEEGHKLFGTITYDNGMKNTFEFLGIDVMGGGMLDDDPNAWSCILYTDTGSYYLNHLETISTGEYKFTLGYYEHGIYSNTLKSDLWWELHTKFENVMYTIAATPNASSFDGKITANNIDELVSLACRYYGLYYQDDLHVSRNGYYITYPADSVRVAFYELFGIMPDLTLSKNYNAQTKTIAVKSNYNSDWNKNIPLENTSKNGNYVISVHRGTKDYTLTFNSNLFLVGYEVSASGIIGDSNGDGVVNIRDATEIQKHTAAIITISANNLTVSDVNSDGNVNVKDATAIQKYVAGFNTGYPIG